MTTLPPNQAQQAGGFAPTGKLAWQVLSILGFLALGMLVFVVFSHYYPLLDGRADWIGRLITGMLLLAAAWGARRDARFRAFWLIPLAYFIGLAAISIDKYLSLSRWLLPVLNISVDSVIGLSIEKLESSLLGICVVLVLNRLSGQKLSALYIRRGKLWLGLGVGVAAFVIMTVTVIPITTDFFRGQNLSWARIIPWAPWVLIFVLANASDEELIFRGLFLGKIAPLTGAFGANLVTTLPFVFMHSFTSYASDNFIFLFLQLLPFALAWCWLMQRTNAIWGSILFHAAMDIPIVVGIFSGF